MDKNFPDIYYDNTNNNPCISSPNAPYAIFFYQTRDTLFLDADVFKKFIENGIKRFRKSRTYTNYKSYLYDLGFTNCQILGNISSEMATIEMHHNGITIFDIALMITSHIVNSKQDGKISTFDLVMELKKVHRNNEVPIVMLCKTMHQMYHNNDEFILPASMTFGMWYKLLDDYKFGITYGIAKKLSYWIKLSIEHSYDDKLNAELISINNEITKWSGYNEYCYGTNRYNSINSPVFTDGNYNRIA